MDSTPAASLDWTRVEHVLLDMDGTVLDLAFDSHFWTELVPVHYARLHGLTLQQAQERLAPFFSGLQGRLEWYCLDHWSELTGLDLAALKAAARARIAPLPGSEAFLRAVRDSGRSLWLVTNAHRDSWRLKMEHTGLGPRFDLILCAHDFGVPKEDPRFWPALRQQHDFDPRRALFVDDSLPVLRAARDYGFGALRAIRHPDSSQPRREIEEFAAVDRLEQLLPIG
ncbi:MAG: GMP/IMP nucleotidase [Nevskia sp.]|nr:GMP/IMP nucleotidase [Nevskia sp.]